MDRYSGHLAYNDRRCLGHPRIRDSNHARSQAGAGSGRTVQPRPVCGRNMNPDVEEKALKCIRCGFCLDACPTFRLTGNEADSPRGRIYIMRSIMEGEIPLESAVTSHIDSCLGCRACETACPSGVQYAEILEHFRADL